MSDNARNPERESERLEAKAPRDDKLPTYSDKPAAQEVVAEFDDEQSARRARDEALADDLPTARLELPPQGGRKGPAAMLTVVARSERQRDRAVAIVRESGASRVKCK